jgi:DNA-binding NarL/FixJ family response regulator
VKLDGNHYCNPAILNELEDILVSAKSQKQSILNEWTDLWFSPDKKAGYVAVTDFQTGQRFYGYRDIEKLSKSTRDLPNQYISLNAFEFGSRKTKDLKQIRNIGIDIDQYKLGITIEQALDEIQSLVVSKRIPEPNMVLTSRGVQIFYSLQGGAAPAMWWLASYVTEQFIGKLKHLGADFNAKDASRVLRVPLSVNPRNNSLVKPEIWNDTPYTFDELKTFCKPLEDFTSYKKKQNTVKRLLPKRQSDKLSFFYRTNSIRLMDLEKLVEIRKGNMTHCRNAFLYVYGFHQALICSSFSDYEVFLLNINSRLHSDDDKPLSKKEFKDTIKSAYEGSKQFFDYFKDNGYRVISRLNDGIIKPYKTESLIDMFDISIEEQRELQRLIGPEVAKEKDTTRKRKERRENGTLPRKQYNKVREEELEALASKVLSLKEKGYKQKDIALELGISKGRVSQLIKKFNGMS